MEIPTRPHRKCLHRRVGPTGIRYLTFSCYKRHQLLGNPLIRDALLGAIHTARTKCGFRLLAWVVMPEHVHLIVVPGDPDWPVDRILPQIKSPFAQRVIARWRDLGTRGAATLSRIADASGRARFWQPGGGFDRAVRNIDELIREVNYVHRNPIKRGLAPSETGWAWSSAHDYSKLRSLAAEHGWRNVAGAPGRPAIPSDSVRVDRHDFPDSALGSIWIDGNPCVGPIVPNEDVDG